MQTGLVLIIVAAAFGYVGMRIYRSFSRKGGCGCGCGCGCSGCNGKEPSGGAGRS